MAASADPEADAKMAWTDGAAGFPVGHSLNPERIAETHGAFFNPGRPNVHATGFLLKPDGSVIDAVYSTGSIGRLNPEDALRVLDNVKKREPEA